MERSEEFNKNMGRFKNMNSEELRKISQKGGQATAEKHRKAKKLKEVADIMLSCELTGKNKEQVQAMFPELESDDITYASLVVFGQIMSAIGEKKANAKSFELLMELQDYRQENDEEKDQLSKALEEAAKKL